jgi:transcriptional regulator with XRE-family HTH domain
LDLGRRLRELRRSRRMSLYDVERRTGRHFSTIGKYERGERRPSVETLRELAEVYEVSLSELLAEAGQDGPGPAACERPDLQGLLAVARRLSPEQVAALIELLRLLVR